ncbi:hypothetical protein LCGC14_1131570, partial [marine sediment metagenome]
MILMRFISADVALTTGECELLF